MDVNGVTGDQTQQAIDQGIITVATSLGAEFLTQMQTVMNQALQGIQDTMGDDPDYPNQYDGF